jgi:hypothetical protein
MSEQPFTNRELKAYFDDFKEDLRQIKEDMQVSRKVDNERFLSIERDLIDLKLKHENIGTKMAGIFFVIASFVGIIINKLFQ